MERRAPSVAVATDAWLAHVAQPVSFQLPPPAAAQPAPVAVAVTQSAGGGGLCQKIAWPLGTLLLARILELVVDDIVPKECWARRRWLAVLGWCPACCLDGAGTLGSAGPQLTADEIIDEIAKYAVDQMAAWHPKGPAIKRATVATRHKAAGHPGPGSVCA